MFEVLVYLFENYMEGSANLNADPDTLFNELELAGFNRTEIGRALEWLEGLARLQEDASPAAYHCPHSIRVYADEECERLGAEERGFLLYLEQLNIIDAMTREVVIDRLMALDKRDIDQGRIKWVVLLALFNQPEKKAALTLLQEMILSDAYETLH